MSVPPGPSTASVEQKLEKWDTNGTKFTKIGVRLAAQGSAAAKAQVVLVLLSDPNSAVTRPKSDEEVDR